MTTPEPDPLDGIPDEVIAAAFAAVREPVAGIGLAGAEALTADERAIIVAVYRAAVVGDELDDHEARLRAIPALSTMQRRSVDVVLANLSRRTRIEIAVLREAEQAQASEHGMVDADVLQRIVARGGA